jgi:hypothetical protein
MTDTEKILQLEDRIDTIDGVLMGKVSDDIKSYEINGKNIDKYEMSELIKLSDYFKEQLRVLKIKTTPRKVQYRF